MPKSRANSHLASLLEELSNDDLRTLRAIINGKLGKRKITAEQQARMQEARKKSKTSGEIKGGN